MRLLASPLSEDPTKSTQWRQVNVSCGVVTDMSTTHLNGEVRLRIREESRQKALLLLRAIRARGRCTPALASKVRGNLGWVTSLGKAGRGTLQCFKPNATGRDIIFDADDLSDGLPFLESLLAGALPDRIYYAPSASLPVDTVFSDAEWAPRPPFDLRKRLRWLHHLPPD